MTASLKLPWQPLDPDGDGILARVVHDAGTEHVALFDTAEQARAVCDTMNRAAGVEAERSELAGELQAEHALVLECVHLLECWRDYQASRGVECGSPSAETDAFLRKWHCEPCPPLRTRAKVDAEIAEMVRDYVRDVGARDAFGSMERDRQKLLALVAEPTAPEIDPLHPTGRCTCSGEGRCDWCILACPGCSFRRCDCQCDPEVCSCEESERLKARVAELEEKGYRATALLLEAQQQASTAEALARELAAERNRLAELSGADQVRAIQAEVEVRALREQCNRQEHGFARRESALQRELGALQERMEKLATIVGQVDEHVSLTGEGHAGSSGRLYAKAVGFQRLKEFLRG